MRQLLRCSAIIVWSILLTVACGSPNGPDVPSYPEVAGQYTIEAPINDPNRPHQLQYAGIIYIIDESRSTAGFSGDYILGVEFVDPGLESESEELTGQINSGTVSATGDVTFRLAAPDGSGPVDWQFNGQRTGDTISGTWVAHWEDQMSTGSFTAVR